MSQPQDVQKLNPLSRSEFQRRRDGHPDRHAMENCQLFQSEIFWRDHYLWLEEQGYLLRPRYHPDWVASWKDSEKGWVLVEDGQLAMNVTMLLDATRIEDGKQVALKRIRTAFHAEEVNIGRLFSSELHASHTLNHCVPIFDVLDVPDVEGMVLVAMPLLSDWRRPGFDTIGEFVSFVKQVFEGLRYMHINHVAHNDVKFDNVMMDSLHLYDEPVHPTEWNLKRDASGPAKNPRSRTERPVRYYHIDFGHANRYDPAQGPPLVGGVEYGGDHTVPEFATQDDCDPFPVDVYRVGNIVREFKQGDLHSGDKRHKELQGLEFMEPLLRDMCQDDPAKRPTMEEVVARFEKITKNLSGWKLRSRMPQLGDRDSLSSFAKHWTKQICRIARLIPSVPRPPPRV